MSKEEIIKKIDYFNQHEINVSDEESEKILRELMKFINEIIDLYNKEKEKNASLQKEIKLMKSININDNYINKEKVKNKIKELEKLYKDKYFHLDYVKEILKELLEE